MTHCNTRLAASWISLGVSKNRVGVLRFQTTAEKLRWQGQEDNSTKAASNRLENRHLIFRVCLAAHCSTTPESQQQDQDLLIVVARGSRCCGLQIPLQFCLTWQSEWEFRQPKPG